MAVGTNFGFLVFDYKTMKLKYNFEEEGFFMRVAINLPRRESS